MSITLTLTIVFPQSRSESHVVLGPMLFSTPLIFIVWIKTKKKMCRFVGE